MTRSRDGYAVKVQDLFSFDRQSDTGVDGHRVRLARQLRSRTQADVAGKLSPKISAAALSQIESRKVQPTAETARNLAAELRVPENFFSSHSSDAIGVFDDRTFFRDLRSTSSKDRKRAASISFLVHELVAALDEYVSFPRLTLPQDFSGKNEPDDAAAAVRLEWGLGEDKPVEHVVRSLERNGIPVVTLTVDAANQGVDAFSVPAPVRPIVLLSDNKANYVRSRFDAAHELGHLVLHRDAEPGTKEVEAEAHEFASSFLLPDAVAKARLPRLMDQDGWRQLAGLKREFGISMAAQLVKGRRLGILTDSEYTRAMKMMSARGWRKNEPGDREMGVPETSRLLELAIRRFEVETSRSVADLVSDRGLPIEDMQPFIQTTSVDRRPMIEL